MLPRFRHACETTDDDIRAAVAPALLAHRDDIYRRHLVLPIAF